MYDKIGGSDVIDPSRMSSEEKLQFINSLYQLHSRIFDGVDRSEFIPYCNRCHNLVHLNFLFS